MKKDWQKLGIQSEGFGIFPYIIVKSGYARFIQIPIYFTANPDYLLNDQMRGKVIVIPQEILGSKRAYIIEEMHKQLILLTKDVANYLESRNSKEVRLCLVEGPKTAYYYEKGEIEFHESIPSGGVLTDYKNQIIALHTKHFKNSDYNEFF